MLGTNARKRLMHHSRELNDLEHAFRTAPPAEVPAAYERFRVRLDQIMDGWRVEMVRRARLLGAPRVYEMVENIREVLDDRYEKMASDFALRVLEPVQRPKLLLKRKKRPVS